MTRSVPGRGGDVGGVAGQRTAAIKSREIAGVGVSATFRGNRNQWRRVRRVAGRINQVREREAFSVIPKPRRRLENYSTGNLSVHEVRHSGSWRSGATGGE